ncbi:MAG: DUF2281 domain-containing protein [Oscillospiraceae bacterium]|jgi:hypothetical protein|nr:DUF2281 domain-containing protein [Oscillospiraceae bacterium]
MSVNSKRIINNLLDELPDNQMGDIVQYLFFIKKKCESGNSPDLLAASGSSMDFWDNPVDDEVWNNA